MKIISMKIIFWSWTHFCFFIKCCYYTICFMVV